MSRPYRPSNGCEGADFQDQWCARCMRDKGYSEITPEDGCQILAATMALDEHDPDYPPEWITDDLGPRCTAFESEFVHARIDDPRQKEMIL